MRARATENQWIGVGLVHTPQFGSVIMAATPARQIQFVGRLKF